jgi:hypothetical protein
MLTPAVGVERASAPGRIRTCDLLLRRQSLYPSELRGPRWEDKACAAAIPPVGKQSPYRLGDRGRRAVEAPRGDSQHPVAGQLQIRIARAVALERATGAVELEAVELDDQPLARPQRVDLEAA